MIELRPATQVTPTWRHLVALNKLFPAPWYSRTEWLSGFPLSLYVLATSKVISRLVTVCAHGDFIELSHWETRLLLPWPDITLSHTEPTSPCPILVMLSAWLRSDKYQFLSDWFDSTSVRTREVQIPWSPRTGDGCTTHLATPSGHTRWQVHMIHTKVISHQALGGISRRSVCWWCVVTYTSVLGRVRLLTSDHPTHYSAHAQILLTWVT